MTLSSIVCLGEALIDWVCLNPSLNLAEAAEFTRAPGGAPANVAVGLAKLGYPVQFIGGMSADVFGDYLQNVLTAYGVDTRFMPVIPNSNTRHAYVLTDENGNRVFKGFSLYANADSLLEPDHIPVSVLQNAQLLYVGSVLQASPVTANTINSVLEQFAALPGISVYDPNYRAPLWNSEANAFEVITHTATKVDVVKLSDDEITKLTGMSDIEMAAHAFWKQLPSCRLLVVTCGGDGSFFLNSQGSGFVASFPVNALEMTGAGDGFVAGLMGSLSDWLNAQPAGPSEWKAALSDMKPDVLKHILLRANAVGALATLKPGAMSSLPTKQELTDFLACNTEGVKTG
jgi:fructokinase